MRLLPNLLLIAGAASLGLAVGFALRAKPVVLTAESPAMRRSARHAGTNRLSVSEARTRAGVNSGSPLAARLERDLARSSGVTRWLYWLEALEKAAPADFPGLARIARGDPTATRSRSGGGHSLRRPRNGSTSCRRRTRAASLFSRVRFKFWPTIRRRPSSSPRSPAPSARPP